MDDTMVQVVAGFSNWERTAVVVSSLSAVGLLALIGLQIWALSLTRAAVKDGRTSAEAALGSVKAAQDSALASENAVRRAEEEMDVRLRAAIGIGTPRVADPGLPGFPVLIQVPIRNYGDTPANNMDLFPRAGVDLESLWDEINGFEIQRRNAIFPDEEFPLNVWMTWDQHENMTQGTETIYVATRAYYSDYLNRDWVVESSHELLGDNRLPIHIGLPSLVSDLPEGHPARAAYDANRDPTPSGAQVPPDPA
ncbi:MAG: hypothetical protein IIC97_09460 [Chloroflexi bacterium]|nr:hypothetical protein [Chloroflexota bacterium]